MTAYISREQTLLTPASVVRLDQGACGQRYASEPEEHLR